MTNDMREAFERWRTQDISTKDLYGPYWEAFKAGAALSAPAVPEGWKARPLTETGEEAERYRQQRGPEWIKAFDAIRSYRMSNMGDEDGYPYPLVDRMSRDGDGVSIADGEWEMIALTDDIIEALAARPQPPASPSVPVEEAAQAGWNACRRSVYAVCEDVGHEAEEATKFEGEHAKGYASGMARAAKSIARGFCAMEATDDDNFTSALRSLAPTTEAVSAEAGLEPKGCPTPGACSCPAPLPAEAAEADADFIQSLQGHAALCETYARQGGIGPEDLTVLAGKFRDAAFVVEQLTKLRDGRMALGWELKPASTTVSAEAVKVKPLEWSATGTWTRSDVGEYAIAQIGRSFFLEFGGDIKKAIRGSTLSSHPSLLSAQTAAQADCEARILSAPEPAPVQAGEPVAWQHLVDGKWKECSEFVAKGWGNEPAPGTRPLYLHPSDGVKCNPDACKDHIEHFSKEARDAYARGAEATSRAAQDVLAERRRQVDEEGYAPEHDDAHDKGEIAGAAACYALYRSHVAPEELMGEGIIEMSWPWDADSWKPKDRRHDLVRAGALIIAEIERYDRAATPALHLTEGEK